MAYTSEIEKLEQRYRENPKGRNFAPLADAYRKAGLIDNAIELCQEGLKLHPDYISAHIVYGRCLMDKKDVPGAEGVFRKVLALDAENVLALRTLSEIAERGNRPDEAMEWLARLLAADPMNGDAAEALARVKGKSAAGKPAEPAVLHVPEPPAPPRPAPAPPGQSPRAATARAPTAPPPRPAPPVAPPPPALAVEGLEIERASAEAAPPAPPAPGLEILDGTIRFDAASHEPVHADGIELQDDTVPQPDRIEVEGLARTQYESAIVSVPAKAADSGDAADDFLVDLPLILPDEVITPAHATPPPDAPAPRRAPPPAPAPPGMAPLTTVRPDDDGAADRAALSRAEPVVTETMAELYLKQGHREDALRVYQALLARRPDDSMLQRKVATLSGHGLTIGSGQSAGDFLRGVLHGQPAAPVAPSSTLAGAFAGAEVDEPTPGAPTRLADDTISLDALFGEAGPRASAVEAPGGAGGVDAPSAFHEHRSPAGGVEGAGGGAVAGGFSFDEFFSSPTGGGGPGGAGGVGASGGAPAAGAGEPGQRNSGRQARPVTDDEGDLDQFQAWLKKLKS